MLKLVSSAALGLSVIVALTTAPVHAKNISFGVSTSSAHHGFAHHKQSPKSHGAFQAFNKKQGGFFIASPRQRGNVYRTQRQSFIIGPTQRRHDRQWYRR